MPCHASLVKSFLAMHYSKAQVESWSTLEVLNVLDKHKATYDVQDIMYKSDFNGPALLSATRNSVHTQLSMSTLKHAVWRIKDAFQQAIKDNEILIEQSQMMPKRQIPILEEARRNRQSHIFKLKVNTHKPEQRVNNTTGNPKVPATAKSIKSAESPESSVPSQTCGNPKPVEEKSPNSALIDLTIQSDRMYSFTQPQQIPTSQTTVLMTIAPSLTTNGLRNLTANSLSTLLKDLQLCLSEATISALISHGFDGALVSIIKEKHILKDDYGIYTYGERRKIWNAIEVLRQKAKKGDDVQETASDTTEQRGTKRSFSELEKDEESKVV